MNRFWAIYIGNDTAVCFVPLAAVPTYSDEFKPKIGTEGAEFVDFDSQNRL